MRFINSEKVCQQDEFIEKSLPEGCERWRIEGFNPCASNRNCPAPSLIRPKSGDTPLTMTAPSKAPSVAVLTWESFSMPNSLR